MLSFGAAAGGYIGRVYVSSFSVSTIWVPFLLFNLLAVLVAVTLPKEAEGNAIMAQSFAQGMRQLLGNRIFLAFWEVAFS